MTYPMEGQESLFDLDTASGKTYPEPCPATAAKTSRPSSRSSRASSRRDYSPPSFFMAKLTSGSSGMYDRGFQFSTPI